MNTSYSSSFHLKEKNMYKSLLKGFIPDGCKLDHLGIQVEKNKIVTPGVIFQFQPNDERHVTVLLADERVGSIFYKEENGYIIFFTYNNDYQKQVGSY